MNPIEEARDLLASDRRWHNVVWRNALAALISYAESADKRVRELTSLIENIDAHATPYGDIPDEPGFVGTYLVTAGSLHKALGKIGHSSPSCAAETEVERLKGRIEAWAHRKLTLYPSHPSGDLCDRLREELLAALSDTPADTEKGDTE